MKIVTEKIYSKGYAEHEYGVTGKQLDRFVERMTKEMDAERKAGRLKPFTGKLKRGYTRHHGSRGLSPHRKFNRQSVFIRVHPWLKSSSFIAECASFNKLCA